jgi:hypothetical protein
VSEQQPSKESLREVKREYKERRKTDKERQKAADKYWAEQTSPGGSSGSKTKVSTVGTAILTVGAISAVFLGVGAFQNLTRTKASQATAADPTTSPSASNTKLPSPTSTTKPVAGNTDPRYEIPGADPSDYSHWGYGTAGLKAPAPAKIGSYTSVQVADALAMTMDYLRAAILMPEVITGGKIDPVLSTFSDQTRQDLIIAHRKSQSTRGKSGYDWLIAANMFRPGDWTFKAQPGTMPTASTIKVSKGKSKDSLEVSFQVASRYTLLRKKTAVPVGVTIWRQGVLRFYKVDSASVTRPDLVESGSKLGTEDPTSWDCGNWVDFDYFEVC